MYTCSGPLLAGAWHQQWPGGHPPIQAKLKGQRLGQQRLVHNPQDGEYTSHMHCLRPSLAHHPCLLATQLALLQLSQHPLQVATGFVSTPAGISGGTVGPSGIASSNNGQKRIYVAGEGMSALTTQCSLMLVALCWDNPEHGAASSVCCYCLLFIAKACTLQQLYPALCGRPVKCSSAWCTSWTPCSPSPAGTQDGQQGIIYTVPKGGSGRQTFITCPATGGCNKPIGLNIITGHLGGANGGDGFLFANRRESLTLLAPYSLSYQLPACICAAILSQHIVNTFAASAGPYPLLLSYRGQWPIHRDPVGRRVHGKWRSWGRQPLQRNPGVAQRDQATRGRPCLLRC